MTKTPHKKRIYLDYNATAPMYPEVIEGVSSLMGRIGNPSSIHHEGRQTRKHIEQARLKVATLVGCHAKQVIFTSGATESNNMMIQGYAPHRRILVSAIEHPSILNIDNLEVAPEIIPVHENGLVNIDALIDLLEKDKRPSLVSIMHVNNETGVIQPIKEIGARLHPYNCLFHSDAVQAVGRIPVHFPSMNVDFLSLSAHKIGGPHGIGALIMGNGTNPPKLIHGGGQERRQRAGTENGEGIHGFGIAAECALNALETYQSLSLMQERIEKALKDSHPSIIIHGENAPRVVNTTCFSIDTIDTSTLLMNLDLEGIALSTGSACSSGSIQPSSVLKAMGVSDARAKSALRLSTGWATTPEDIDVFIDTWSPLIQRLG